MKTLQSYSLKLSREFFLNLTCKKGKTKASKKLKVQLNPQPIADALGRADCRKNSVLRIQGTGPDKNSTSDHGAYPVLIIINIIIEMQFRNRLLLLLIKYLEKNFSNIIYYNVIKKDFLCCEKKLKYSNTWANSKTNDKSHYAYN